jgi:glycosyltransferase involved in cell wall biosynthesis
MNRGARPTLLHVFSTFRVGGPQVRFCTLANHFGRDYRHMIFAMDGHYECMQRLKEGLDITVVPVVAKKQDTLGNRGRFRKYLKSCGADQLVTYNWGSIEWAMANWPQLLPHIHIEDGFGPEEATRQLRRRVLARRMLLSRSRIVVPSRTLERLALEVWKLPHETVRYIPNGVDCARFGASSTVPFPWPGTTPIIGTVAALRPEKNLVRLLEAFRRVRDVIECRMLIAGDGPERSKLEACASTLNLEPHVKFVGHTDHPERIYAALAVFAISSDTEQMPTSVIEAASAGLAIAATDVGDISLMLSRENRPYIMKPDAAALAQALAKLLENPGLRKTIGTANRTKVCETFDQHVMFDAYDGLYRGDQDD